MNMKKKPRVKIILFILLSVVLLFTTYLSMRTGLLAAKPNTQKIKPQAHRNRAKISEERYLKSVEGLQKLRPLFERNPLPFPIELLAKRNAMARIKPYLKKMPEMQRTLTTGTRISGVYIADTLIMPEKVTAVGITFILARHLIREGPNSSVTILPNEHGIRSFFQYVIESDNMVRAKIGLINKSEESKISQFAFDRVDVINANWMRTSRERDLIARAGIPRDAKNLHIIRDYVYYQPSGCEQHINPAIKGRKGITPGLPPTPPTIGGTGVPAPGGYCLASDPSKADGAPGAPGDPGTIGDAPGEAGRGLKGSYGSEIRLEIPRTGAKPCYFLVAAGGEGGDGGDGQDGGQGGQGQKGGAGGPGKNCCQLNPGFRGNGGRGGIGGRGGRGGDGGNGGEGGEGGDGGYIYVKYPDTYDFNAIHVNVDPGPDGIPGGAGNVGRGGNGGLPGDVGAAADGSCGSSQPGEDGGSLGQGGGGGRGGNIGRPASTHGKRGTYEPESYHPDDSCEYCDNDDYCINNGCDPYTQCRSDGICSDSCPIVIDVAGNGFSLTDALRGVPFDLSADGLAQMFSWTSAGSDDAWLALDRNNNGVIDSGVELFGNLTPQPETTDDANGFIALAEFDKKNNGGNADGIIDKGDRVFSKLLLWQDVNHNGVSESGELKTLASMNFVSISLDYQQTKIVDQYGNRFKFRSRVKDSYSNTDGRWAWDVFLFHQR